MSHDQKHTAPDPEKRDYTDADISIKAIVMFFAWSVVFVGVVFAILNVIWHDLDHSDADREAALPSFVTDRQLPAENLPRIQAQPLVGLAVHRAYEKNLVDGGVQWADAGKTKVRIPVTNAMDILVAKKAFPVRDQK